MLMGLFTRERPTVLHSGSQAIRVALVRMSPVIIGGVVDRVGTSKIAILFVLPIGALVGLCVTIHSHQVVKTSATPA